MADEAEGRSTWSKNWMVIDLGLQTGLRVSELANLRVEDIDLKGGILTVREGKGSGRDARKHNATVPLGDNALKRHIRGYVAQFNIKPEDSKQVSSDAPKRLGSILDTRSIACVTRSARSTTPRTRTYGRRRSF